MARGAARSIFDGAHGACLVFVAVAACSAKHPASKQAPAATAAKGSGDPWSPSPGSAYDPLAGSDVPAWAHDPPAVLRDKINGVNAHVIVLKSQATFAEYRDVLATVEKTPGVVAAEPFIFSELDIARGSAAPVNAAVKAVDPRRVGNVLTVGKHMVAGTLGALASGDPAPIILGDTLATKLDAKLGDDVTLTIPPDDSAWAPPGEGSAARTRRFRVAGMFHMDFDEYDGRLAFTSLPAMQALVGRGDEVMGIEMTVKDLDHSGDLAKAIEKSLGGPPYQVMDWYELNKQLFTALFGDKRP